MMPSDILENNGTRYLSKFDFTYYKGSRREQRLVEMYTIATDGLVISVTKSSMGIIDFIKLFDD